MAGMNDLQFVTLLYSFISPFFFLRFFGFVCARM